jgi:hypothetical protein
VLWSIAAGPLVNLLLAPALFAASALVPPGTGPEKFLDYLARLNLGLLILNLLPVYPLDGGQILQALLWYGIGRWRSLQVVSVIGLGTGGLFVVVTAVAALVLNEVVVLLLGLVPVLVALRSLDSLRQAQLQLHLLSLPRHEGAACPTCGTPPPAGLLWVCDHCQTRFDVFDTRAACPACGAWYRTTLCPHCYRTHPIGEWFAHAEALATRSAGDEG